MQLRAERTFWRSKTTTDMLFKVFKSTFLLTDLIKLFLKGNRLQEVQVGYFCSHLMRCLLNPPSWTMPLLFFQPATARVRPAQGQLCLTAPPAQNLSSWTKASVWSPVERVCSPERDTVTVRLHLYNSDIPTLNVTSWCCGNWVIIKQDRS